MNRYPDMGSTGLYAALAARLRGARSTTWRWPPGAWR